MVDNVSFVIFVLCWQCGFCFHYTVKEFWQQTDRKRTANDWSMFGLQTDINLQTAHATVFAPKHRSTVCCPMCGFFLMIIACILRKCYFLDFHWTLFTFSFRCIVQPFVHRRTANGWPKYSSTVCAQTNKQTVDRNIRQPFVHECSVEDLCTNVLVHREHSLTNKSVNRCTQTDSKRSTEIFINHLTSVLFCCVPLLFTFLKYIIGFVHASVVSIVFDDFTFEPNKVAETSLLFTATVSVIVVVVLAVVVVVVCLLFML